MAFQIAAGMEWGVGDASRSQSFVVRQSGTPCVALALRVSEMCSAGASAKTDAEFQSNTSRHVVAQTLSDSSAVVCITKAVLSERLLMQWSHSSIFSCRALDVLLLP